MTLPQLSCYRRRCETIRKSDSRQNGERRQDDFPHLVELKTVGTRLVFAFREKYGTEDIKFIAEKLGYKSDKAIYKIISGKLELSYARLRKFQNSTDRSIDWLLNGEEVTTPAAVTINPAAFSTNERLFIDMLAAHRGVSFTAIVQELVGVALDECARELSVTYRKMRPEELEDVLNSYLSNVEPKENGGREGAKKRG